MNRIQVLVVATMVLLPFDSFAGNMSGDQYVGGNVPGEPKQSASGLAGNFAPGTFPADVDGDGCLSKSEVPSDSQLGKRFDTRDGNHDGKLCKDEYYFK